MYDNSKIDKIDIIDTDLISGNESKNKVESDNKKKYKKRKKNVLYNVCIIALSLVFIGCAVYLIKYYYEISRSESQFDDLKALVDSDVIDEEVQGESVYIETNNSSQKEEFVSINGKYVLKKLANLYSKNNDFVGWITIPGAGIDYPVMQTMNDEEYYIYRDFYKKYSSSGTLFVDTDSDLEKPSDVILIYGHNMKAGTMFHDLIKYEKEDFYNEHKYLQFDSIYGSGTYEVIAAFRDKIYPDEYTGVKYYEFFDAKSTEEFETYIDYCKSMTPYEIDSTAIQGDKLICLSTCAYHTDDGRFVVIAKKMK